MATLLPSPEIPADLRTRAGQLVLCGFRGLTPGEAERTLHHIRSGLLGSVLLYDVEGGDTGAPRNITSRMQARTLLDALHAAAPDGLPLLAAMDEEGGYYHRLKSRYGFFDIPSPAELASRGDPEVTRHAGARIAEAYAELGINLNLAPVVDLARPGNKSVGGIGRAFSDDPAKVVEHAAAFIEAHHERGVLAAIKHFPGSGSATYDAARGLEISAGWTPAEVEPFAALIARGLPDAVLVTRAEVPALDPDIPPMLSRRIVEGMLRQELGFDGVAITDAMEMMSIWGRFGFDRAAVMAIAAGIDLLLFCNIQIIVGHEPDRAEKTVDALVSAVERGELAEERLNEACRRVVRLKSRMAPTSPAPAAAPGRAIEPVR